VPAWHGGARGGEGGRRGVRAPCVQQEGRLALYKRCLKQPLRAGMIINPAAADLPQPNHLVRPRPAPCPHAKQGVADATKERASEAVDSTQEAASKASDKAAETAQAAADKVGGVGGRVIGLCLPPHTLTWWVIRGARYE